MPIRLPTHGEGAEAGSEPVIFTTDVATSLARANLVAAVSVIPGQDRTALVDLGRTDGGFTWFGGTSLVRHELYLGHDTLFDLPPGAGWRAPFGPLQL